MNPLTAIRSLLPTDLRGVGALPGATGSTPTPAELRTLAPGGAPASTGPVSGANGSFGELLTELVGDASAKSATAGQAVSGLLSGQQVSLHQAVLAMEEASVSFQLMVEVRNKLLESYQELMRMQV